MLLFPFCRAQPIYCLHNDSNFHFPLTGGDSSHICSVPRVRFIVTRQGLLGFFKGVPMYLCTNVLNDIMVVNAARLPHGLRLDMYTENTVDFARKLNTLETRQILAMGSQIRVKMESIDKH